MLEEEGEGRKSCSLLTVTRSSEAADGAVPLHHRSVSPADSNPGLPHGQSQSTAKLCTSLHLSVAPYKETGCKVNSGTKTKFSFEDRTFPKYQTLNLSHLNVEFFS